MYNPSWTRSTLKLAEPSTSYEGNWPSPPRTDRWVEVLVDDRPTVEQQQQLYTYRIPPDLIVQPGDILSVSFGSQVLGAIAIRLLEHPPTELAPEKIKEVEEVVSTGFFPPTYWQLLQQVASYYHSSLMQVIRFALPPGLLGRSQRRIRLTLNCPEAEAIADDPFLTPGARNLLETLRSSKTGDLAWKSLQRQVKGAPRGLKRLLQREWVESYLEPPKLSRPKLQKAVTIIADTVPTDLTPRQREIWGVLRQRGGELWLQELLQICSASSSTVKALAEKGCLVITEQEILRQDRGTAQTADLPKTLTPDQTNALNIISSATEYAQILLHGVTGSGKTEIYLQAIAPILERGKSAIVLVPEIGLTPQLTDRFRARFGSNVFVYHSALSDGERYDTWRAMTQNTPQIVIGTRSAIFSPLPKLGLIILDEEHDSSFKQDQRTPTYHARTVAQWRAQLENCPLILGSATPSLETWVAIKTSTPSAAKSATIHYLSLPERIGLRPMPPIEIVDMRLELKTGNRSIFSRALQEGLQQLIEQQNQGILFIPRRGHSTFVSCRSCGYVIECSHCDVSLSYHYIREGATQLLRCHYCGDRQLQPKRCPECDAPYLKHFGTGTQKVVQELAKQYPALRVIRFDSDTTRTKDAHRTLLTRFANREADLLVGTQMLTKGLDIAGVTLVGVVAADGLLHQADYRASERAFQTLTQVAGRAGRGEDPGRVIIQTYSPEHPAIPAVRRHEYESFVEMELAQRAALNYPPYGRLILLRVSGLELVEVQATAQQLAEVLAPKDKGYQLLGPAPANIMRVADRYRWQLLLKFPSGVPIELPNIMELRSYCPRTVSLAVDVDPLNIG